MTKAQFRRLPKLLQEIIMVDRQVRALTRPAVVDYALFKERRARQRELKHWAAKTWGVLGGARKDGPALA